MNAVRPILYVRLVGLAWTLLSWAGMRLVFSASTSSDVVTQWFRASSLLSVGLDIATLVTALPFARAQRNAPAEPTAFAYAAVSGVSLLMGALFVVNSFVTLGSDTALLGTMVIDRVAFVAAEVCLWLALLHASGERPPAVLGQLLYGAIGVATVLRIALIAMPSEMRFAMRETPFATVAPWVATVLYLGAQIVLIVRLHQVAQRPIAATNTATPTTGDAPTATLDEASPWRDMAIGAAWLLGGLIVTLVSYEAAASSSSGGRYLVTTGPIAYGLIRLFRGLLRQGRS